MAREPLIKNVTDTALWVAAFRAREGQHSRAAFQDPLAALLAGPRGTTMAREMPNSAQVGWSVVIRTSAIDWLINEAMRMGVDTVINLGAGLDTRPYRMELPPRTRWIEIDFESLVEFKNAALVGHTPTCNLERIGIDLTDRAARRDLFKAYGSKSAKILLIAEGVIPYFSNEDAASIADDLHAIPSFHYWILDFDNAGIRQTPPKWAKQMAPAPFLFQANDWFKFFAGCGWHAHTVRTSAEEADRLGRPYPFGWPLGIIMYALPRDVRRRILNLSGAVLLEKRTKG